MITPNLPVENPLKENGAWMDSWLDFLDQLVNVLQANLSDEGFVPPSQSAANITEIQNHQLPNGEYTTQFGTLIYNETTNSVMFAINDGTGKPIFKTATLT